MDLEDGDVVTFSYRLDDGLAISDIEAEVSFNIVKLSPEASDDIYFVHHDTALEVDVPGVLGNDQLASSGTTEVFVATEPVSGELDLGTNGAFIYDPLPGFSGIVEFEYYLTNGEETSDPARVLIHVENVAPVGDSDFYTFHHAEELAVDSEDGVLENDDDFDGDSLSALLVTDGLLGDVELHPNGSFSYTPHVPFVGTDFFVYQANDGAELSSDILVTIQITNQETIVVPDVYTLQHGDVLQVDEQTGFLANDFSPDGDPLTATVVTSTTNGFLDWDGDGAFYYEPDAGFVGEDYFLYEVTDGVSTSEIVQVTLVVGNQPPVAQGDFYRVIHDGFLDVASADGVLANDLNLDFDAIQITHTDPVHGELILAQDGSFVYEPDPAFVGFDSFEYFLSDGPSESQTVTVQLDVFNTRPTAILDVYNLRPGEPLDVAAGEGILANDVDADGDELTIDDYTNPDSGSLALFSDGSFVYTPIAGFVGQDRFTYRITDGAEESDYVCLLYTSPSPRDLSTSRMPSSA